jgi:hypothetical protein
MAARENVTGHTPVVLDPAENDRDAAGQTPAGCLGAANVIPLWC